MASINWHILCAIFVMNLHSCFRLDYYTNNVQKRGVQNLAEDLLSSELLYSQLKSIGCHEMIKEPGFYYYVTKFERQTNGACSLFLIGAINSVLRLSFPIFNIQCQTGGSLRVLDGWEMKGEFFPSTKDTNYNPKIAKELCLFEGNSFADDYQFTSTHNVVEIQYKIPGAGEGFVVKLEILENPLPCNAIAMAPHGIHTIRNFGREINCALGIIYPEKINVKLLSIGQPRNVTSALEIPNQIKKSFARLGRDALQNLHCNDYGVGDYVEFKEGNGLDPSKMRSLIDVCGKAIEPSIQIELKGEHSVVRMVSSGKYENMVSFEFNQIPDADL